MAGRQNNSGYRNDYKALPFEKANAPEAAPLPPVVPEQVDWSNVTVLVAEDNKLNMEMLTALAHGMNGHVAKPIDPKQLFARFYENLVKEDPS